MLIDITLLKHELEQEVDTIKHAMLYGNLDHDEMMRSIGRGRGTAVILDRIRELERRARELKEG